MFEARCVLTLGEGNIVLPSKTLQQYLNNRCDGHHSITHQEIFILTIRGAGVPVRAINGDLWPTNIERSRRVTPDFDARVMMGSGHYPMLERPAEFNRLLTEIIRDLEARQK